MCYGKRDYYYDPRRHISARRETDEERAARKARERQSYEERYGRQDDRHDSSQRDDDSHKRKSHDDRGKSHITEDPSNRAKLDDKSSSELPAAFVSLDIPSRSPALKRTDIQSIINRPPYQVEKPPTALQSRFPHWCLKGVRFDLDLVPVDKQAMLRNLDAVKLDIERMSG